jgi:hypothetical protein
MEWGKYGRTSVRRQGILWKFGLPKQLPLNLPNHLGVLSSEAERLPQPTVKTFPEQGSHSCEAYGFSKHQNDSN